MKEYLIVSRGGQGGVTASRILATAAVLEGKWAQAIPEFGAERRGAVVRSYLRVSDEPIRRHSSVKSPEGVAIFSGRILEMVPLEKIAPSGARLLINSREAIKSDREVYYVDATGIAMKLGLIVAGWPLVNTSMASAMAKVFEIASLSSVMEALKDFFKGKLLEVNTEAVKLAWEAVR